MRRAGMPPDQWQIRLLRSKAERTLLLCSRQSGKSTVTAAMALHEVLFRPKSLVLLLSPSLRQSQELFRKVTDFRNRLGEPIAIAEESALRGFSGVRLIIVDEAARVDDPLYYSIRPMLAVSGGRMVCLTTPFGKRGFFYEEWTGDGPWDRIKVTARECPRISAKFLEEERASLGEWWYQQEYECSFSDTTDQFFRTIDVEKAFSDDVTPLFPDAAPLQPLSLPSGDVFLDDIDPISDSEQ
jgi:hypothetical protein